MDNNTIVTITECVYSDRYLLNERSILSFKKYMDLYPRAVVHLDVYDDKGLGATKDMFAKHFNCDFIISYTPNFSRTLNELWSHELVHNYEVAFHYEPDWELLDKPNERLMLRILRARDYYNGVNLRAYHHLGEMTCLSPCWLKTERIKKWLPFDENINPEYQLHFVHHSHSIHRPQYTIIKDIGREWAASQPIGRLQQKHFLQWVKKEN